MSYASYKSFTEKQAKVIYKSFMRGNIQPPNDARGRQKRPGFVYDFVGAHMRSGSMSKDDVLLNIQILALCDVVECVCNCEHAEAQAILDGTEDEVRHSFDKLGIEPGKMWKNVF